MKARNNPWVTSPNFLLTNVVKNVSETLTLHLPEAIKGWRLGRGELAGVLARAALLGAHPTRTAEVLGVADEDTVSYQLRKVGVECPAGLNLVLGEVASELLEKGGKHVLAVDTTEVEYWGEKDGWVHYSPGRGWVHRFVGLSVVGWRRCVPLSLKPVSFGAFPADLVLWALGEAERLGLRVDVLLLDRGFHSVEVALLLKSMGTPFVIGARKTKGIKRLLKDLDKNKLHAVPYRMRGQTPWGRKEVEVTLVAYHGRKGWVTLLCWGVDPGEAKKYSLRWGIETCFRMVKKHRARTCSRSLPLRWLLLLTSTLLYLAYLLLALREEEPPRSYEDFAITLLITLLLRQPGEPPTAG